MSKSDAGLADLLKKFEFSRQQFDATKLDWALLSEIRADHERNRNERVTTGNDILARLQMVPCVHSVKMRVKNGDHLISKIIRKRLDEHEQGSEPGSYEGISLETYADQITDLIGVRALHLFKDQWKPIHDYVLAKWNTLEAPIAYYRKGDPDDVLEEYRAAGCKLDTKESGYRSIHYVIECGSGRAKVYAELQVRTLFEEAWSEIDHQVRYPRKSSDVALAKFLAIFNGLAGSADEMGTFIKALRSRLIANEEVVAEQRREKSELEQKLTRSISQLQGQTEIKEQLEAQLASLRKLSITPNSGSLALTGQPSLISSAAQIGDVFSQARAPMGVFSTTMADRCANCGNAMPPRSPTYVSSVQIRACSHCGHIQS